MKTHIKLCTFLMTFCYFQILKVARPAPARSPLQSLEPNQDAHDEDRTTVTRSFKRRVSFSRTNKVQ
jgi:hypothetical protein